jgi:hypothetical protein
MNTLHKGDSDDVDNNLLLLLLLLLLFTLLSMYLLGDLQVFQMYE